jgi:DNA-damage-inducible protein D
MTDEMSGAGADDGLLGLEEFDEQASRDVRRAWHDDRWFFSVIDVVGLLTDAPKPRQYWYDMKRNIHDEGFVELSENIRQLKMLASDGRMRLTDCADVETMLRIIQSIPSPKAEPFKQWLARVGRERLEEVAHPELAADRMRQIYRKRGYSAEWIKARLDSIMVRDELTTEWRERGAHDGREFAQLTEILEHGTFDVSTQEHRAIKSLKPRENLRDNMTPMELVLTSLAEMTATELHRTHDSQGYGELADDAHEAGEVSGATRRDIEARIGRPVVSHENAKTLTQPSEQQLSLFGEPEAQAKGE